MSLDLELTARLHGEALYRLALHLSGSRDNAWDLLQDTYERALRSGPREVPDDKVRSWLSVVMRNLHHDQCRRRRRHREVELFDGFDVAAPSLVEDEAPCEHARFSAESIRSCLPQLTAPLRAVYVLHAFSGLSYSEISSSLGLAPQTVGTRLHRARQRAA
jgi:RNA polymerase sigma-70 factor (ECF subfamily)